MNPFIVNGAIPNAFFCDRKEETKQLISHIANGRNVVLSSSRRIGKTGLIQHCYQNKIFDDYYTFFIDILHTSSLQELTFELGSKIFETLKPKSKKMIDLFVQTVKSISGEFGYDPLSNLPKFSISLGTIENPEYTLDEIFKYIELSDKRCVIAIDEFQQITRYPEKNVEAILRSHIQQCRNANFIFAGSERHILADMFNSYSRPFYASTTMMSLEAIKLNVYTDFVKEHFEEFEKKIDPAIVEKVYNLFNGNTYCMQRTFNVAFELTEKNEYCQLNTIILSINKILEELDHSYRMRLSLLTSKPKELLFAIANEGEATRLTSGAFVRKHHLTSPSSVQSALKQLFSEDWITFYVKDNTRIYSLSDVFLRLWILKNNKSDYEYFD